MNTLDLSPLAAVGDDVVAFVAELRAELCDTWEKRQIFRTDTEARVSVLNDGRFPTMAAKYWQAVREQAGMLDQLMAASFHIRKMNVRILRAQRAVAAARDDLDREEAQIDLDQYRFELAGAIQMARDRVRELRMWSAIKAELDNGSFNTRDPNAHQMDSLEKTLTARAGCLTRDAGPGEVMNIAGPLATIQRLAGKGNLLE